mmetsp:Transcript_23746/g.19955  ORF Transcript_23746/g.19955 Transcript_23746/m.19955 type:complete len:264 (-) Transcript_23746:246-1037(-)
MTTLFRVWIWPSSCLVSILSRMPDDLLSPDSSVSMSCTFFSRLNFCVLSSEIWLKSESFSLFLILSVPHSELRRLFSLLRTKLSFWYSSSVFWVCLSTLPMYLYMESRLSNSAVLRMSSSFWCLNCCERRSYSSRTFSSLADLASIRFGCGVKWLITPRPLLGFASYSSFFAVAGRFAGLEANCSMMLPVLLIFLLRFFERFLLSFSSDRIFWSNSRFFSMAKLRSCSMFFAWLSVFRSSSISLFFSLTVFSILFFSRWMDSY